jgi:hypothetical protein
MRQNNLTLPAGATYSGFPVLRLTETHHGAVLRLADKLTRALHYKHTGRIVPGPDAIRTKWWSNAQRATDDYPIAALSQLKQKAPLVREGVNLDDQFGYVYETLENGTIGVYHAMFRRSFAIVGFVSFDPTFFDGIADLPAIAAPTDQEALPSPGSAAPLG